MRVVVTGQSTASSIAHDLDSAGLHELASGILDELTGDGQIMTGNYDVTGDEDAQSLARRLITGRESPYGVVTVTAGMRLSEVSWQVGAAEGDVTSPDFDRVCDAVAADPDGAGYRMLYKATEEGTVRSLDGYLAPGTYEVNGVTADELVDEMLAPTEILFERAQCKADYFNDALTIASIVEKTTQRDEERASVSSVIHNRLRAGMLLQMDPTVLYGAGSDATSPSKDDLEDNNDWNTFVRKGLPPTPICAVSEGALRAAMAPAATDYLYMRSVGAGRHVFAHTTQELSQRVDEFAASRSAVDAETPAANGAAASTPDTNAAGANTEPLSGTPVPNAEPGGAEANADSDATRGTDTIDS